MTAQLRRPSDFRDVPRFNVPLGTFVSMYAGAGGLDIGFALAGFRPVWVNEFDKHALATHDTIFECLESQLPHLRGARHDSHVGDVLAIPEHALPGRGSADLVIGGPPCQGFSVAGKMDPNDARSQHVFHFMNMVERVRPRVFVMENVKNLYSNSRWTHIRRRLHMRADELGYDAHMVLCNAADFGAPQARERMFLIGTRRDLHLPQPVPVPATSGHPVTVREALAQLPHYGETGNDSMCVARVTLAKVPVLRRSPYAGMIVNGAGRPLNLDAPSPTLPASMGGNKTPIVEQPLLDDANHDSWVESYHRSLVNGARPLSEPPPSAGLRRLTVQEAAVLQSFPLGMKWCGPQSAQYRQIGNAVPPRLALAVARAVAVSLQAAEPVSPEALAA